MKKCMFMVAALVVGILVCSVQASAGIHEGEWSMTTVIHMDGMDEEAAEAMQEMESMSPEEKAMMENMMGGMGMKMGAAEGGMGMTTTMTQCLTNDNPVPEASDEEECETTHSMNGNTLNFETICEKSHSTGKITYKNDTMKGRIQSVSTESGAEQQVTLDISGEYVGPCGAESTEVQTEGLSAKELAIREKELELKAKELELKEREMGIQSTPKKAKSKASLQDVNNAVNTTNNVRSTIGGLRSLLGR